MATGYPTPNEQVGDVTFGCIPIFVPNNPEFNAAFAAAIYGLYAQMSKEWFWREQGTLTPQMAAFYSSQGLAITEAYGDCMDCEDVASCIEEQLPINQTLRNALYQYLTESGFNNPNRIDALNTTLADRNSADGLTTPLGTLEDCNLDVLWGAIRHGIVQRLDDEGRDLLENLALISDPAERLGVFIDVVPVLGDVAEGIVFQFTEIIPDVLNLYDAYSSESTMDEIACEIFGMVCADCRYPTWTEIITYYQENAIVGIPDMNSATLETVMALMEDLAEALPRLAYHTVIYWMLLIINLKAVFNGLTSDGIIREFVEIGEDFASDNWFDLCDTCQQQYRLWTHDFSDGMGAFQWVRVADVQQGTLEGGAINSIVSGATRQYQISLPVDPTHRIRRMRIQYERNNTGTTIMRYRPTPGSNTGAFNPSISGGAVDPETGWLTAYQCNMGTSDSGLTGINEIMIFQNVNVTTSTLKLRRVEILYDTPLAPFPSSPTTDLDELCCCD